MEGVRARCVPGGDAVKSDEEAVAEMGLSVATSERMRKESDYKKRSAFLIESLEECKSIIEFLKEKKK